MDIETAVTMDSVNESRLLAVAASALSGIYFPLSTRPAAAEGPGDDDDDEDDDGGDKGGDVGNIDPDDDGGYDDEDDDDEEPLQVRHRR